MSPPILSINVEHVSLIKAGYSMIQTAGEKVFLIDNLLYSIPSNGAVYLVAEDKLTLIDTGPATSAEAVIEGIREVEYKPQNIDFIILTHIHLDHSGGVGLLLQEMPRARVFAHHKAIKHLLDPTKLVTSAIKAQGPETLTRNGEVLPVDNNRLIPVFDLDRIKLSDKQTLTFLDCPGHAPHEICIYESRNRGIFVGDAVGHIVNNTDVMVPVTPPPSFNPDQYLCSLKRLLHMEATVLYFPHYGWSASVTQKLEAAVREIQIRNEIVLRSLAANSPDVAVQMLIEHIKAGIEVIKNDMPSIYDFWLSTDIPMSATEHVRYFSVKSNQT